MNLADPNEAKRTTPDRVIYDPTGGQPRDWDDPNLFWLNEHILVQPVADGDLLATWTSERLDPQWLRVAYSRSADGGKTWTIPQYLDGHGLGDGHSAAWQVPIVAPSGRIYIVYTYSYGRTSPMFGGFRWRTSDDHGRTWSAPVDLDNALPLTEYDTPDSSPMWICCAGAHIGQNGEVLLAYTHWANNEAIPGGATSNLKERSSQIEVMRINNLADNPELNDLDITWYHQPVTVPHVSIKDASFAQEPYLVNLPDGRIFMIIRTNRGEAWYSVSSDGGASWREAEPLRYQDGGDILKQPASPCPVFALDRGDFVFLYNNNDGYVFGAKSTWTIENRRPAYIARGEFRPDAHQPIWWSKPHLFIDNDAVPWGPPGRGRLEAATYPSFTELKEERILWYPDRKGFLCGRFITNDWLARLEIPS